MEDRVSYESRRISYQSSEQAARAAYTEAMDDEEIARLLQCERRLAAVTRWLEANQPNVFSRGLWDAIHEA